jgi:hypothetical protein
MRFRNMGVADVIMCDEVRNVSLRDWNSNTRLAVGSLTLKIFAT